MKKLLFILLFPILCQGQTRSEKISDALHYYCGAGITVGAGALTYKLSKGKKGLSTLVGFSSGVLAGIAKEVVWDRKMGRGTYSELDMGITAWGALGGAMVVTIGFQIHEKNLYIKNSKNDPEYYELRY